MARLALIATAVHLLAIAAWLARMPGGAATASSALRGDVPARSDSAPSALTGRGPVARVASVEERRGEPVTIRVWHSFRDRERLALHAVARVFNLECTTGIRLELVDCDDANFTERLERAIQAGEGPDVFFWAHDKIGEWVDRGIVLPADAAESADYLPNCREALRFRGRLRGFPLAYETLILYHNASLLPTPPSSVADLVAKASRLRADSAGVWPLVYERGNFYYHAMWLHGFGGRVLAEDGSFDALSQPMLRSLAFARDLATVHRAVPDTVDWNLQVSLFNSGRAAMLISGPWAWGALARDSFPIGMAVLPFLDEAGRPTMPFLGVKAAFVGARTRHPEEAAAAARALTSGYAGSIFSMMAGSLPAQSAAYREPVVAADRRADVFKEQLLSTVPMPSSPVMARVWKVMMTDARTARHGCLDRVFLDRVAPEAAAAAALAEFRSRRARPAGSGDGA